MFRRVLAPPIPLVCAAVFGLGLAGCEETPDPMALPEAEAAIPFAMVSSQGTPSLADGPVAQRTLSFSVAPVSQGTSSFSVQPLGGGMIEQRLRIRTHPERQVRIFTAMVHIPPGGGFVPWHTHPGPTLVVVTGGGVLTLVHENCDATRYPTGAAFQAPDHIHTARNNTDLPVTGVVTFIIEADRQGVLLPPTTLEPVEVQDRLNAACAAEIEL